MKKVDVHQAVIAQDNYYDVTLKPNFWDFVGDPTDETPDESYYTYPDEAARMIEMLAGPHHRTILKAIEARKANDQPTDD